MIIFVDCNDSSKHEDVLRIINKICESGLNARFIDLESSMGDSKNCPSLKFIAVKTIFDTEIPQLNQTVVIDRNFLGKILSQFDGFQKEYLILLIESIGYCSINLNNDKSIVAKSEIQFDINKDFYIDLEKQLIPLVEKIKEDPFNKVISAVGANGFYLGKSTLKEASSLDTLIILQGGAGQKISYEEYVNWIFKTYPLQQIEQENWKQIGFDMSKYCIVRQHHPIEVALKKMIPNKILVK